MRGHTGRDGDARFAARPGRARGGPGARGIGAERAAGPAGGAGDALPRGRPGAGRRRDRLLPGRRPVGRRGRGRPRHGGGLGLVRLRHAPWRGRGRPGSADRRPGGHQRLPGRCRGARHRRAAVGDDRGGRTRALERPAQGRAVRGVPDDAARHRRGHRDPPGHGRPGRCGLQQRRGLRTRPAGGAHRLADRPAQPRRRAHAPARGDRPRGAVRSPAVLPADRSRPLQAGERRPWAPGRRSGAARGGRHHRGGVPGLRRPRPLRWRRVRPGAAGRGHRGGHRSRPPPARQRRTGPAQRGPGRGDRIGGRRHLARAPEQR